MNIEKLDKKALDLSIAIHREERDSDDIINLSIEFAISVLEDSLIFSSTNFMESTQDRIEDKIQELKTYLDEKC